MTTSERRPDPAGPELVVLELARGAARERRDGAGAAWERRDGAGAARRRGGVAARRRGSGAAGTR